jgi:hypothetical protein
VTLPSWKTVAAFSAGALVTGSRCLRAMRLMVDSEEEHIAGMATAIVERFAVEGLPEDEIPPEMRLQ